MQRAIPRGIQFVGSVLTYMKNVYCFQVLHRTVMTSSFGSRTAYCLQLPRNPIAFMLVSMIASRLQKPCLLFALLDSCVEASDLPHNLCTLPNDISYWWAKGLSNSDLELEKVAITPVTPHLTSYVLEER